MSQETLVVGIRADDKATPILERFKGKLKETEKSLDQTGKASDGFNEKLEAGKEMIPGLSSSMEGLGKVVGYLKNPYIAATAAVVGFGLMVNKFALDNSKSIAELSMNAKMAGMTISQAFNFKRLSENNGVEFNDLRDGLRDMAINMADTARAADFKAFGITSKDHVEAFAQLADRIKASNSEMQKAEIGSKILSDSWSELAPILEKGGNAIREAAKVESLPPSMVENYTEIRENQLKISNAAEDWKLALGDIGTATLGPILRQLGEMAVKASDIAKAFSSMAVRDNQAESAMKRIRGMLLDEGLAFQSGGKFFLSEDPTKTARIGQVMQTQLDRMSKKDGIDFLQGMRELSVSSNYGNDNLWRSMFGQGGIAKGQVSSFEVANSGKEKLWKDELAKEQASTKTQGEIDAAKKAKEDAAKKAKELLEKQLDFTRTLQDQKIRIERDNSKESIKTLESEFDQKKSLIQLEYESGLQDAAKQRKEDEEKARELFKNKKALNEKLLEIQEIFNNKSYFLESERSNKIAEIEKEKLKEIEDTRKKNLEAFNSLAEKLQSYRGQYQEGGENKNKSQFDSINGDILKQYQEGTITEGQKASFLGRNKEIFTQNELDISKKRMLELGNSISSNLVSPMETFEKTLLRGKVSLGSSFKTLFSDIGDSFGDMLIKMSADLLSKAAIFGLFSLVTGGGAGFASAMGSQTQIGQLISAFPGHASGTNYSPGGWHIVGERGPEMVNIPRGSSVSPIENRSSGNTYTVNISNSGIEAKDIIREFKLIENQNSRSRRG